ncbi:unnamed protein product, partial [Choristocarpus tenellus]
KPSSKLETEFDFLKESFLGSFGRTDLKTIDDGLRTLSFPSDTHVGLWSFSDEEDEEEDDSDENDESEHHYVGSGEAATLSPGPVAAAVRRSAAAEAAVVRLGKVGQQCKAPLEQLSLARAQFSADEEDDNEVPWAVIKLRSEQEIFRTLDPRFFVEDFDPIMALLEELPDYGPVANQGSKGVG